MTIPGTGGEPTRSLAPLALSTMYAQRWPHAIDDNLGPFFDAGRQMGFERFELSHVLGERAVESLGSDTPRIASVHHPCPRAGSGMARASLVAELEGERRAAEELLGRTIDVAARLKAEAVVLHLGAIDATSSVDLGRATFELRSRYAAGQSSAPEYADVAQRLLRALSDIEPRLLDRAEGPLRRSIARAADRGVVLALETGYDPLELPSAEGMRRLLDGLAELGLAAWLDTGHVGALANLGLTSFDAWWEAIGGRLAGVHLHDVRGLRDHLAPGAGDLDFRSIARRIPAAACLTCELDWYLTPNEVVRGADHLFSQGIAALAARR